MDAVGLSGVNAASPEWGESPKFKIHGFNYLLSEKAEKPSPQSRLTLSDNYRKEIKTGRRMASQTGMRSFLKNSKTLRTRLTGDLTRLLQVFGFGYCL